MFKKFVTMIVTMLCVALQICGCVPNGDTKETSIPIETTVPTKMERDPDYVWYFGMQPWGYNGTIFHGMSSSTMFMDGFDKICSIEKYRQVKDDWLYVVYDRDDGYGNIDKMYLFFSPIKEAHIAPGEDPMENKEKWMISGERVFFVHKQLCYEDFSGITKGSTFAEVAAVDPAAWIQEPYEGPNYEITVKECRTCHYLTDGILFISYSRDTLEEPFTITAMRYQDSHELGGYDMSVHPDDLP